jgi:hypothetical protein
MHGLLLRIVGASSVPPIFGTLVPAEEPSTASEPEVTGGIREAGAL